MVLDPARFTAKLLTLILSLICIMEAATISELRLPAIAEKASPGCPFHPARTLTSLDGENSWQAQHVSLKAGLDYLRLISNGSESNQCTQIYFGDERLILGSLYTGEANIHSSSRHMGSSQSNQWFRFSSNSAILESDHQEPTQIDLILCSRKTAQQLQVFESVAAHSGMGTFASGEEALSYYSAEMKVETKDAAHRIARANLSCLKQRLRLEAGILSWIAEILAQSQDETPLTSSSINTTDRESLDRIVRLLRNDPGRDYSLPEICQMAGMNENKFKSAFKQLHGQTAFAFLRSVRMDHASHLLREDRASVIEVANEVGYSNPSHFARAFKEQHGLLPKAYQCLHRTRINSHAEQHIKTG